MNKNDLVGCLDRMVPDQMQKEKMLQTIMDARRDANLPMKRRIRRPALIAAVIILCFVTATTALAIGFGWDARLIAYLQPSEKQMQTLSGAVGTPNATLSKDGVTITVKQTLADSFGIYVLYDMTVPEGITLDNDTRWERTFLDVPGNHGGAVWGSETLEQHGNHRTVLMHRDQTEPLENGTMELILGNLTHFAFNPIRVTPVLQGEWELKWDFTYVDTSKIIDVGKPLSINGSHDTITKAVISPMSVCIFARGDDILCSARPVVNFKNGTQISFDFNSKNQSFCYYLIDEHTMLYEDRLYYRFENIINLEDVESIAVGDVTIPIDAGK